MPNYLILTIAFKGEYVQRTIGTKQLLPWITQEIKRTIQKRDRLYDKYKRVRRPTYI